MRNPTLGPAELARYGRHLAVPEIGENGQRRLKAASVAVVGAGGLGSPALLYLAAAGVGRIRLIDDDRVAISNLQRQVLFGSDDVGREKVLAAKDRLAALNPHVVVDAIAARVDPANSGDLLAGHDIVLDGTDNLAARYAINDACVRLGIPYVFGSVFRFEGQVSVFWAGRGPCYRCLHPDEPSQGDLPDCATAGVLGVLPGLVGSLQALEAMKLVLAVGDPLLGRLLLLDGRTLAFREIALRADPQCRTCGSPGEIRSPAPPSRDSAVEEISVEELRLRLDRDEPLALVDVRTRRERAWARLPDHAWIPVDEIPRRLAELDPQRVTVVYCHHGGRSARVAHFLRERGFPSVLNLHGGIDAWSLRVDPSVPRY